MTSDPAIATAADYADALLTARAKNLILLVVLLTLIVQLGIFFVGKYTTVLHVTGSGSLDLLTPPSVTPPTTAPIARTQNWHDVAHFLLGGSVFLGLVCTGLLAMILFLILKIMLVGRLIGVARLTSAFVWTLFVLLLIFPWQAFLRNSDFSSREFIIPGVLYTWDELAARVLRGAAPNTVPDQIVFWARFVAWPVVAVIVLLVIHAKSNRGLKQALGEDVLHDEGASVPLA